MYPFLAMQADHAFVAVLIAPSRTTSLPMSLFIVSTMASEPLNMASLKLSTMLAHLPAAACAASDRPDIGFELEKAPGWGPVSASNPSWAASAVPR